MVVTKRKENDGDESVPILVDDERIKKMQGDKGENRGTQKQETDGEKRGEEESESIEEAD